MEYKRIGETTTSNRPCPATLRERKVFVSQQWLNPSRSGTFQERAEKKVCVLLISVVCYHISPCHRSVEAKDVSANNGGVLIHWILKELF